jgi:hypothetical protein
MPPDTAEAAGDWSEALSELRRWCRATIASRRRTLYPPTKRQAMLTAASAIVIATSFPGSHSSNHWRDAIPGRVLSLDADCPS